MFWIYCSSPSMISPSLFLRRLTCSEINLTVIFTKSFLVILALVIFDIEKNLPNNIEIFLEDFSKLRKTLKEIIPEQKIRAEIIHALLEHCNKNDFQIEYNKLEAKMNEYINKIM